jgi:hypothetical protein
VVFTLLFCYILHISESSCSSLCSIEQSAGVYPIPHVSILGIPCIHSNLDNNFELTSRLLMVLNIYFS